MSDQDPQAPTADTPEQHTDEPVHDWEKRYTDLQPEYTRVSQEAAQYRQLAERARNGDSAALRELTGYELDDQPEEPEYGEDPYEAKFAAQEARIAAQEKRWEEQQQAEQMRAIESHLEAGMAAIPDLNKDDHDWVALRALNSEALPNGMPDVQSAYEALQQRDLAAQKRWASTKRAPSPPVGQAGNQQPAFSEMTREQRAEYMAQRADSLED